MRIFTLATTLIFLSKQTTAFFRKNSLSFKGLARKYSYSMVDSSPHDYVSRIFEAEKKRNLFSVLVTGGGITSLQWLFTTSGASRSLKSGEIPYSRAAAVELFGNESPPSSFCSAEASILLAKKAYERTVKLVLSEESGVLDSSSINVFGVGCTAALATKVIKRGDHRCYLSIYSPTQVIQYSVVMDKEALSRQQEDEICSQFLLHMIGEHCQFPSYMNLHDSELKYYRYEKKIIPNELTDSVARTIETKKSLLVFPSSDSAKVEEWKFTEGCEIPPHSIIFPGSFNPLHVGHIRLVEAAIKTLQGSAQPFSGLIIFEIAAVNVDKPPLETGEVIRRLSQFSLATNPDLRSLLSSNDSTPHSWTVGVAITSTPKFVEKCALFPNQYYVIGADTMERLLDKKYYPVSLNHEATVGSNINQETADLGNLIRSISLIDHYGCKFLVGGRLEQRKGEANNTMEPVSFQTVDSVLTTNPTACLLTQLVSPGFFRAIDEKDFRVDLSSTEIRKQLQQQQQSK